MQRLNKIQKVSPANILDPKTSYKASIATRGCCLGIVGSPKELHPSTVGDHLTAGNIDVRVKAEQHVEPRQATPQEEIEPYLAPQQVEPTPPQQLSLRPVRESRNPNPVYK